MGRNSTHTFKASGTCLLMSHWPSKLYGHGQRQEGGTVNCSQCTKTRRGREGGIMKKYYQPTQKSGLILFWYFYFHNRKKKKAKRGMAILTYPRISALFWKPSAFRKAEAFYAVCGGAGVLLCIRTICNRFIL